MARFKPGQPTLGLCTCVVQCSLLDDKAWLAQYHLTRHRYPLTLPLTKPFVHNFIRIKFFWLYEKFYAKSYSWFITVCRKFQYCSLVLLIINCRGSDLIVFTEASLSIIFNYYTFSTIVSELYLRFAGRAFFKSFTGLSEDIMMVTEV